MRTPGKSGRTQGATPLIIVRAALEGAAGGNVSLDREASSPGARRKGLSETVGTPSTYARAHVLAAMDPLRTGSATTADVPTSVRELAPGTPATCDAQTSCGPLRGAQAHARRATAGGRMQERTGREARSACRRTTVPAPGMRPSDGNVRRAAGQADGSDDGRTREGPHPAAIPVSPARKAAAEADVTTPRSAARKLPATDRHGSHGG